MLWCASFNISLNAAMASPVGASCESNLLNQESQQVPQGYVVIVAGYSSGADIAPALRARGVKNIIHVQPSATKDTASLLLRSYDDSQYVRNIIFDGDYNALLTELSGIPLAGIIAGTETGVALADRLNEQYGLPGNGTQFSEAKRNKYLMHQQLKAAGVPSMRDILTSKLQEILDWIDSPEGNQGQWPVVVKPVDSAATEGVFICSNPQEVTQAFQSLLGRTTLLGTTINQVLVQEYLDGTEFVVNTASLHGKNIIGEIWKYHKKKMRRPEGGLSNIYLFDELMEFVGPESDILSAYAAKVLKALNIVNGPAHLEIMMTARGPVLVEVGARLMGGHTHIATRQAVGVSPLDLSLKALLWPQEFEAIYKAGPLKRLMPVRHLELVSSVAGTVKAVNHIDTIRRLPSFWSPNGEGAHFPHVGEPIERTIDLLTSAGSLWLLGASEDQISRDYETIRRLETTMFEVE